MNITLSPQRAADGMPDHLAASKFGDVLTVNGQELDFSGVTEGMMLPAGAVDCPLISDAVRREGGVLYVTLILPHGPNPSSAIAFPSPIEDAPDGPLEIPQ